MARRLSIYEQVLGHRRDQLVFREKPFGVESPEYRLELPVFGCAIAGLFREPINLVGAGKFVAGLRAPCESASGL